MNRSDRSPARATPAGRPPARSTPASPAPARRGTRRAVLVLAAWVVVLLVVLGVPLLVLNSRESSAPAQPNRPLRVLPFPGTPDVSSSAQVVFMSLAPSDLASVSVTGSSTGRHTGSLTPQPGMTGVAFTPDRGFGAGETVTVKATTVSETAAVTAGAVSGTELSFSFRVVDDISPGGAKQTTTTAAAGAAGDGGNGGQTPASTWTYRSRADLHPPVVIIPMADQDPGSGFVFLDAQFAPQSGPLIIDDKGEVVWFLGLPDGQSATGLRVQSYQGKPVLTWWQGTVDPSGHGLGTGRIVDESYQPVATVKAAAGYQSDLHEFLLTPRGTALITVYSPARANLSGIGGPKDGVVYDGIVQEIDIASGRVLWEWHALGHVPISDSYQSKPDKDQIYDFFHINSVQELDDGDLLVSARNTWTVYRISRDTGRIVWRLGGKQSSFSEGAGMQFEWQHDARLTGDTLTLFNNAADPQQEDESRAMRIQLNERAMTARLSASRTHTPPVLAGSQGNVQALPNGNWFVGWGDQPYFSEFTPAGVMVFDGKLPGTVQSYRAFRFPWTGRPAEPPVAAIGEDGSGSPAVYVSWNGATGVDRWEVLGGDSAETAVVVATAPSTGFETAVSAGTDHTYLAVRALSADGQVMATAEVKR